MIEHIWTVICQSVVIDKDSSLVSIFNVLEELSFQPPDFTEPVPFDTVLVSFWGREALEQPARGQARVTVLSPSEKALQVMEYSVDLSQHERLRARGLFQGIQIKESGLFRFKVELQLEGSENWKLVASIPLKVNLQKPKNSEVAKASTKKGTKRKEKKEAANKSTGNPSS